MRNFVLFDISFLAHRAYHSTGGLTHEGEATGVSFGVLRDIEKISDLFGADVSVMAFDSDVSKRERIYPAYKATRKVKAEEWDDEERQSRDLLRKQIEDLRTRHLPRMGYKNILQCRGYEADDILAAVAFQAHNVNDDVVIVSADKDLWQCLDANVCCYNPATNKVMNAKKFRETYGILPSMWASVKALAGCPSDDIEGVPGVGEKTAAQYYSGAMKKKGKRYEAIVNGLDIYNRNIHLTRLPLRISRRCRRCYLMKSTWRGVRVS